MKQSDTGRHSRRCVVAKRPHGHTGISITYNIELLNGCFFVGEGGGLGIRSWRLRRCNKTEAKDRYIPIRTLLQ